MKNGDLGWTKVICYSKIGQLCQHICTDSDHWFWQWVLTYIIYIIPYPKTLMSLHMLIYPIGVMLHWNDRRYPSIKTTLLRSTCTQGGYSLQCNVTHWCNWSYAKDVISLDPVFLSSTSQQEKMHGIVTSWIIIIQIHKFICFQIPDSILLIWQMTHKTQQHDVWLGDIHTRTVTLVVVLQS